MKIFENKGTGRSPSRCSYCRSEDHVARDCPQVEKDWAYWKNFRGSTRIHPTSKPQGGDTTNVETLKHSKWYNHCNNFGISKSKPKPWLTSQNLR